MDAAAERFRYAALGAQGPKPPLFMEPSLNTPPLRCWGRLCPGTGQGVPLRVDWGVCRIHPVTVLAREDLPTVKW